MLLFGLGALLDGLNVLAFWDLFGTWWPILLIIGGVTVLLNDLRQFIWSLIIVAVGIVLQLRNLEIVDVNIFAIFWPAVIIAIGLSIIFNKVSAPKNIRVQDIDDVNAIFAGSESVNTSKNYQGGRASAVFGGVSIDLRDAIIKKEATLNVFALCGGIELKIPRGWRVQTQVFPILGGVDIKPSTTDITEDGPVLVITGTVALGGVEVRY